jgi:ribonucleoside-diphosphate reductase alpha chain
MFDGIAATRRDTTGIAMGANALAVLQSRYLTRNASGQITEQPTDLFRRVAYSIAAASRIWGASKPELTEIEAEFYELMIACRFLPNSPTLKSAGKNSGTLSGCFVLPLEDSVEAIMKTATDIALVHKAGGGTGVDLSRLRPRGSTISTTGGTTEGPISFLRMLSEVAAAIRQGGYRSGANMAVMRIDHPDILSFIDLKSDLSQVTNYNLSVAVTDAFMDCLRDAPDSPHTIFNHHIERSGTLIKGTRCAVYAPADRSSQYSVAEVWDLISRRAWQTGEPGLIFIDEVNRHNATPHVGSIRATNPCGEQPLLDNEACNLGSINLAAFYSSNARDIDLPSLARAVRTAIRFLDNAIEVNNYPTDDIRLVCRANRRIGLGVMGFADLLFLLNVAYDSEEALALADRLALFIQAAAWSASTELAEERGVFPNWKGSTWDTKHRRKMRNAAVTTVAPTGTISIIAGCSSGIEPAFSLAFIRQILDGEKLPELNPIFLAALTRHVDQQAVVERVWRHALQHGTIQNCEEVPNQLKAVFRTAKDIAPEWHVRMQSTWQKYTDAAVSKTINLPETGSIADVKRAFVLAHDLHCKGITIYRDGSRNNQPMALTKGNGRAKVDPRLDRLFKAEPAHDSDAACDGDDELPMVGKQRRDGIGTGGFGSSCPECRGTLTFESGCTKCDSCGFSYC